MFSCFLLKPFFLVLNEGKSTLVILSNTTATAHPEFQTLLHSVTILAIYTLCASLICFFVFCFAVF